MCSIDTPRERAAWARVCVIAKSLSDTLRDVCAQQQWNRRDGARGCTKWARLKTVSSTATAVTTAHRSAYVFSFYVPRVLVFARSIYICARHTTEYNVFKLRMRRAAKWSQGGSVRARVRARLPRDRGGRLQTSTTPSSHAHARALIRPSPSTGKVHNTLTTTHRHADSLVRWAHARPQAHAWRLIKRNAFCCATALPRHRVVCCMFARAFDI